MVLLKGPDHLWMLHLGIKQQGGRFFFPLKTLFIAQRNNLLVSANALRSLRDWQAYGTVSTLHISVNLSMNFNTLFWSPWFMFLVGNLIKLSCLVLRGFG